MKLYRLLSVGRIWFLFLRPKMDTVIFHGLLVKTSIVLFYLPVPLRNASLKYKIRPTGFLLFWKMWFFSPLRGILLCSASRGEADDGEWLLVRAPRARPFHATDSPLMFSFGLLPQARLAHDLSSCLCKFKVFFKKSKKEIIEKKVISKSKSNNLFLVNRFVILLLGMRFVILT